MKVALFVVLSVVGKNQMHKVLERYPYKTALLLLPKIALVHLFLVQPCHALNLPRLKGKSPI